MQLLCTKISLSNFNFVSKRSMYEDKESTQLYYLKDDHTLKCVSLGFYLFSTVIVLAVENKTQY